MKKHGLLIVLLILALLATGCQTETAQPQGSSPNSLVVPNATRPEDIEPTATYDWMAGESPVPNKRMGLQRAGINGLYYTLSPTGIYFIDNPDSGGSFIRYADNGSDTFIKLCGRPDCNHGNENCNAYLNYGNALCYYGGYLYAVTGTGAIAPECKLIRMEPDGSNHVAVLDLREFAKAHGGDYVECNVFREGYCLFSVYDFKDMGGQFSGTWIAYYLYKLDGSMEEPQNVMNVEGGGMILYNCGTVCLTYRNDVQNGGEYGSYWNWDPETDTITYLTDHPGQPGWFGEDEAYYFKDGAICRLTYASQTEEKVVDTGLKGNYYLFAFPDCIAVACRDLSEATDNCLYIYNWAFELVETVEIGYSHSFGSAHLLIAETAERFILSDEPMGMPKYYINKAELGTGDVKLHKFSYT